MDRLTDEIKKQAEYLGDAVYVMDYGFQLMVFTSDGIAILDKVYLDNYTLDAFLKYLDRNNKIKK